VTSIGTITLASKRVRVIGVAKHRIGKLTSTLSIASKNVLCATRTMTMTCASTATAAMTSSSTTVGVYDDDGWQYGDECD
jgi:hypothetical protein